MKVTDFGLSKIVKSSTVSSMQDRYGNARWAAPEYVDPKRIDERSEKGDIFSFGVIIWELVAKKAPWDIYNDLDVLLLRMENNTPDVPMNWDEDEKDLMLKCWNKGEIVLVFSNH